MKWSSGNESRRFYCSKYKKHLLANNQKTRGKFGIDEVVDICLKEYRERSSFKPDVMTFLLKKAEKLYQIKK